MSASRAFRRHRGRVLATLPALAIVPAIALTAIALTAPAQAAGHLRHGGFLFPGNLLVSTSVYRNDPNIVAGQTVLPPGCTTGCVAAVADGNYPEVWNNDLADASFGVTSPVFLDQISPSGRLLSVLPVPDGSQPGRGPKDQLVTSFSSKSEMALNLSPDGRYVTFMGYVAPAGSVDVSNSNTPADVDPTNPVPGADFRAVAQLGDDGRFRFTRTNAYSGNNGRAAVTADAGGRDLIYTAGNAGNGSNPQPDGIVLGAGAQIITPSHQPEAFQNPGQPTPVGSFSVTQLGDKPDKVGKDDNFRGLAIFNNVLYYSKGSGGNGVNTVYFLDTTGNACPNGAGLPQPGAPLPASPLAFDPSVLQSQGLPSNMCILQGFPTALKSATSFPFGMWFANPHTLYVADEGNGDNTFDATAGQYPTAAGQTTAGLQKWVFNPTSQSWQLAYTLRSGLNLGQPYTVPGYPAGDNPATGLPWSPATDGLRNITGRVNPNGTVTIWAITSTVSGNGDQGADPNKLVAITDPIGATTPPAGESFQTVRSAGFGQVVRGVCFTPGTRFLRSR